MMLEVKGFTRIFGDIVAVDDVSFRVAEGEILCLLGPSGCGKTTLLRLIAGLETADAGKVLVDGRPPPARPYQRDFGMMFQNFALFPHKNVYENIAFGLETRGVPRPQIDERVQAMLDLVDLEGYAGRAIEQLSGGEQQRVALARSLAVQPRLLLLDEPLGALDRALREKLMIELRQIIKRVGVTAISVTHDQSEAFAIADRVAVMNRGRIEQLAPPEELYDHPRTPFVARFLGFTNILPGRWLSENQLETPIGIFPIDGRGNQEPAALLIRPDALVQTDGDGRLPMSGDITAVTFRGRFYQVALEAAGHDLVFEMDSPPPKPGPYSGFVLHQKVSLLPREK